MLYRGQITVKENVNLLFKCWTAVQYSGRGWQSLELDCQAGTVVEDDRPSCGAEGAIRLLCHPQELPRRDAGARGRKDVGVSGGNGSSQVSPVAAEKSFPQSDVLRLPLHHDGPVLEVLVLAQEIQVEGRLHAVVPSEGVSHMINDAAIVAHSSVDLSGETGARGGRIRVESGYRFNGFTQPKQRHCKNFLCLNHLLGL